MDARETGEAIVSCQERAADETPAGFLARAKLDQAAFRRVAEVLVDVPYERCGEAAPEGRLRTALIANMQSTVQVGFHLARLLDERDQLGR